MKIQRFLPLLACMLLAALLLPACSTAYAAFNTPVTFILKKDAACKGALQHLTFLPRCGMIAGKAAWTAEKKGGRAMNLQIVEKNHTAVAVIESAVPLITDAQSALDLMMKVKYEAGCTRFAVNKEAVAEDFFILSTGLAGEILQKFINYGVKFAIYGDFSGYTSKPLRDFLYESNQGRDIFFQPDAEQAVEKLALQKR